MVKANFAQYDATAANNTDVGGVAIASSSAISLGDDAIREIMSHIKEHYSEGSIASATTTDIGAENAFMLNVTGTTTITGLGTIDAGTYKLLIFAGALTFTHGSSLVLPGAANITTAAGDCALVVSEGSGNWRCVHYLKAAEPPYSLLDEDDMATDSATQPPSQQSVKAWTTGQQTMWMPAAGMTSSTTNGAASGTGETTTNAVMYSTLDFDASTEEHAQFFVQMPKSWDEGTLIAQFVWSHASTATNFDVVWGLSAVAFGDGDALDTAFGTEVTVTDTGGTTDDIYISSETSAITVAGSPGAEEFVVFQVARVAADGSDTLAVDARLHGVKIHYTIDTPKDD